uniref:Uncharacterized protein n=1 Tax=Magallana gigas TaxID=29159 RepID=K1R3F7_MAGGI
MVGVRILIVDRVFGETVNLRGFELSKIMIKFSELTSGSVLFRRDTQVFLGDKMCPIVSAELHHSQALFTTTTLAKTAAITFMLFILWKCAVLLRTEAPVPARHQKEPTPTVRPTLRRSQRVRRVPERLVY